YFQFPARGQPREYVSRGSHTLVHRSLDIHRRLTCAREIYPLYIALRRIHSAVQFLKKSEFTVDRLKQRTELAGVICGHYSGAEDNHINGHEALLAAGIFKLHDPLAVLFLNVQISDIGIPDKSGVLVVPDILVKGDPFFAGKGELFVK